MTQNLLLFSIGTTTWGVGDQDITAVTAARPLHHLPLSPPSVAGMALIEDRPVTVFDLGACLGAPPLTEPHKGSFLLITRDDRTTAFAVAGKVDRMDKGADKVVPLPAPARSSVVESCLVREASIVPIINMQELLERVKQGDLDVPSPLSSAIEKREMLAPSSVLVVALGNEKFCIDAANASYREGGPREITALPYAPKLAGVISQGENVVPVLSLSERIGLGNKNSSAGMILTEIHGQRCGLPVDREEGRRENVTVLALPPVARPAWSRGAVVENGEVIPLIGLSGIGAALPESKDENYLAGQYHPASAFPGNFRKGSVEVIELSLFGTCHAVPKDEVAEVLPLLPFRRLTQVSEIVLGVAELKGRLIPVLDLEAIFGRRSPVTPDWKMLRMTNGDFDALVVIETVFGGKELSQDMQRQVPIAIPHQVLYGCYLDSSAVRLILNVEALAVHFEKTEIRDLLVGMSPAMPSVLSEPKKESVQAPAAAELPAEARSTLQVPLVEQPTPAEMHGGGELYTSSDAGAGSRWHAPRADKGTAAKAQEAAAEEEVKRRAEAEARERVAAEARVKAEVEARDKAAEEERLRREAETRQRAAQEAREGAEAEARAKAEDEARQKAAEEERQRIEETERQRAAQEAREQEAGARAQAEEETRRREAEEVRVQTQTAAEARQRAEDRLRQVITEELRGRSAASMGKTVPAAGEPSSEQGVDWKWPVAAALAAVAVIAFLFYLTGKTPEEVGKAPGPVKQADAPAPTPPKVDVKKEPEAPLYLNVPLSMPKPDPLIYVVVKGDTLWGIAKRFTGNPFNYPRVARDNSIATPDLIFPGQKIKLIQEKR